MCRAGGAMSRFSDMDDLSGEPAAPPSPADRLATILSGLTPNQAEAATLHGPVLVLAGAGTGKTRTLTAGVASRIAMRGIQPSRILAVTFTNKAAKEMGDRIRTMLAGETVPSWVGTFHGLGAWQLRIEPEVAVLRPAFDILDADDSKRLVKRTLKAMNIDADVAGDGRDPLKQLCNRIAKFKDNLITPDEAPDRVEAIIAQARLTHATIDPDGMRMAARLYLEYQRRLREANAADFGDLLLWPTKAMHRDEAYRKRWAERFDCILADEYQDVCYAQYAWLRLLSAGHGEIFVVGDDDQSVYSFRGADITFIRRFTSDFPKAREVRLEDNFRSTGHILSAANAVIAQDKKRLGKTLRTTKAIGDPIEVVAFHDPESEAAGIVGEIKRRGADGVPWDQMAILYRSNHMSRGFEEALMRSRIPYVLIGDVGFYQRAEIKDALALLRLAVRPDDFQSDEAFRRVCNTPPRGIGPKALEEIHDEAAFRGVSLLLAVETAKLPPKTRKAALYFADAVRSVGNDKISSLADQLCLLLDRTGYRAMLRDSRAEETENRLENLQELVTLAGGFHNASELLDHAALASAAPGEATDGRVQLMSIHKGKGLEFAHVFLPGWDATTLPSAYGDLDEERRLAYVALTRGMQRVSISYVEYRRGFTRPSPFIDDIPTENRVAGWLHAQPQPSPKHPGTASRAFVELDALELLRRF
jgi:DNA helicase II / ATP-dependent DNA helicase PcrA